MYTEAAFVMFIALFFYFSAKKKYLRAGIMAALASGTRIVGCILVFSLIIERHFSHLLDIHHIYCFSAHFTVPCHIAANDHSRLCDQKWQAQAEALGSCIHLSSEKPKSK